MQFIHRNDVPEYLRKGSFFAALDPDDQGAFAVPAKCLKADQNVQTKDDLIFLLKSLQYWQLSNIPDEILHFIYTCGHFKLDKEFPELLSILQKLKSVKEATPKRRIPTALRAKLGVDMITWLHAHTSCELSAESCGAAAGADDLESLTYLHENGCPWDSNTIKEAVIGGSVTCLEYAHTHGCPALPAEEKRTMDYAAEHGHTDMIKYLRNSGEEWDENTMTWVARSGNLDCMKYLHESGCPWDNGAPMGAATNGHLACLRYAHEHGCALAKFVVVAAAANGDMACLQYAHEHGCPWDALVTNVAARNGHTLCLKYAHENGCPWDQSTASTAFDNSHFDCCYYAVTRGACYRRVLIHIVLSICLVAWLLSRDNYLLAAVYVVTFFWMTRLETLLLRLWTALTEYLR